MPSLWLLTAGALVRGDILVLDNAKVHFAESIKAVAEALLYATGVEMMFLPAYSPELNPCELIFGLVKAELRTRIGRPVVVGGATCVSCNHARASVQRAPALPVDC